MLLTAIAYKIMTVNKPLTGVALVDIVMFRCCGYFYFMETPVGMFSVDDVVEVIAAYQDENSMPIQIQLAS